MTQLARTREAELESLKRKIELLRSMLEVDEVIQRQIDRLEYCLHQLMNERARYG